MPYYYPIWSYDQRFLVEKSKQTIKTFTLQKVTNTGLRVLRSHWVLVQMLCVLWFSPCSGIVSQQSPSVCGFLSPLECRAWAAHSWSFLITLAGRRWRKKEIHHKGKGRSKKKSKRELEGEILGQQEWGREFFFFAFFTLVGAQVVVWQWKAGTAWPEFWTLVHVGIAMREPCWSTKACHLALLVCGYTQLSMENNYTIVTNFVYTLWCMSLMCITYQKGPSSQIIKQ